MIFVCRKLVIWNIVAATLVVVFFISEFQLKVRNDAKQFLIEFQLQFSLIARVHRSRGRIVGKLSGLTAPMTVTARIMCPSCLFVLKTAYKRSIRRATVNLLTFYVKSR